jgi:hypothetical protein
VAVELKNRYHVSIFKKEEAKRAQEAAQKMKAPHRMPNDVQQFLDTEAKEEAAVSDAETFGSEEDEEENDERESEDDDSFIAPESEVEDTNSDEEEKRAYCTLLDTPKKDRAARRHSVSTK